MEAFSCQHSENQDAQAQKVSVRFFDQKGGASSFFLGFVLLSKIKNLEKKKIHNSPSWRTFMTSFVCFNKFCMFKYIHSRYKVVLKRTARKDHVWHIPLA